MFSSAYGAASIMFCVCREIQIRHEDAKARRRICEARRLCRRKRPVYPPMGLHLQGQNTLAIKHHLRLRMPIISGSVFWQGALQASNNLTKKNRTRRKCARPGFSFGFSLCLRVFVSALNLCERAVSIGQFDYHSC